MDSHPEIPEKIADIKRTLANLTDKIQSETYSCNVSMDDQNTSPFPLAETNVSMRSNKLTTPLTTNNSQQM